MKTAMMAALLLSITAVSMPLSADTVERLLAGYQSTGAGPFSAVRGAELWQRDGVDGKRRCSACHGSDLRRAGHHQRTGKLIAAMSPAIEAQRLSDAKKVEKWLRRNCKWTWGRTCTTQEKGDLLSFINTSAEITP